MADSITTQIQNQRAIAQSLASGASTAIHSLSRINVPYQWQVGPIGGIVVAPPPLNLQETPEFNPRLNISLPTTPTKGALTDVPSPSFPSAPSPFNEAQPTHSPPTKPGPAPIFVGTAPELETFETPVDPGIASLLSSITKPEQITITIPDAPTINEFTFDVPFPGAAPTAPTNLESALSSGYTNALNLMSSQVPAQTDGLFRRWFPQHAAGLQALENKLALMLAGGTGVDAAVSAQVLEIERSQRTGEYRGLERALMLDAGKRGFATPDGVTLAAQAKALTAASDATSRAAAVQRKENFDREQQIAQFSVSASTQLRSIAVSAYTAMLGNFVQMNGQAIEYARAIVQAIVEAYDAAVKGYMATMEGYKAQAQVAAERQRAELAKVEVYRARLEGEKAKAQVNEGAVRVYEAAIHGAEAAASVYGRQVDAVVSLASLEKIKFEAFDASVRAFGSLVASKEAEWRGYTAEINGQTAETEAWAVAAKAKASEFESYKTQVDALTEQIKAATARNDSVARILEADTRLYEAQVHAQVGAAGVEVEQYKAEVEGIARSNEADGQIARYALESFRTSRELVLATVAQQITQAKNSADVHLGSLNLQVHVAEALGQVLSRMAESALSGINSVLSSSTTA